MLSTLCVAAYANLSIKQAQCMMMVAARAKLPADEAFWRQGLHGVDTAAGSAAMGW
jgi:hypothetical protein